MNHTVLARCPWTPSSKLICMETFLLSIHQDTNLHSMFQAGRDLSLGQHGHPWPHFKDVCKPTTIILCVLICQEGVCLLSRHVRQATKLRMILKYHEKMQKKYTPRDLTFPLSLSDYQSNIDFNTVNINLMAVWFDVYPCYTSNISTSNQFTILVINSDKISVKSSPASQTSKDHRPFPTIGLFRYLCLLNISMTSLSNLSCRLYWDTSGCI